MACVERDVRSIALERLCDSPKLARSHGATMPAMSDRTTDATGLPKAEIIAVGTELTSGAKLDTNSQWLSRELADRGVVVRFHTTVGDDLEENVEAVRTAAARSRLVLITGGLGPTRDDLTREMLARAAGVPLEEDAAAVEMLRAFFAGRGRTMPERNLLQAQCPVGGTMLPNPVGTAPGVWLPIAGDPQTAYAAAMPGVPSEMRPMFLDQIVPRLTEVGLVGAGVVVRRIVNCYGIGESAAEERLGELTDRGRDPEVGITASAATISLRINAAGATVDEADAKADAAAAEVERRLSEFVFGRDDEDVEHATVRDLRAAGRTVATIEVGTAGELARRLDAVGEEDDVVAASLLAGRGSRDATLVGVASEDAEYGPERTRRLAAAVRERFGADYGLAIVADPKVIAAVPVPAEAVAHLAVADAEGIASDELRLLGNPAIHRARMAKSAMTMLRKRLAETG